jgi:hypothetical protein
VRTRQARPSLPPGAGGGDRHMLSCGAEGSSAMLPQEPQYWDNGLRLPDFRPAMRRPALLAGADELIG